MKYLSEINEKYKLFQKEVVEACKIADQKEIMDVRIKRMKYLIYLKES
ncbi:MAG: hypothetical protein R2771_01325 [Saprospiraceae bacterium]